MSTRYPTSDIRHRFLDFFRSRNHLVLPSASLIPESPSTLLTGAGMQPFITMFRGEAVPPGPRIATCQKCVRAGDIDQVGRTARHHTFFEMLGNFSFGDYFKEDAIAWGWELVTEGYGLDKRDLWVTIYEEDDESFAIWRDRIGVPDERIVRCGKKDNWWPQTVWNGPCGPCSEIIVDQGPGIYPCDNPNCGPRCDCDRFLEVWNLVFQMYNQSDDGSLTPLPAPGIDTGLGLERLAAVLQGVRTNFEIDIFRPLIAAISAAGAGPRPRPYGRGGSPSPPSDLSDRQSTAIRIIADHSRAIGFMVADRILPSNEGRGYVLRRFLRRAFKEARHLGIERPFVHELMPVLAQTMAEPYPEIHESIETISRVVRQEEERFCGTLAQGMGLLEELIADLRQRAESLVPGSDVFRLYDTFGFPWELTEEIAAEAGLTVDRAGFEEALERQRQRSVYRYSESAAEKGVYVRVSRDHPPTRFVRDEGLELNAQILAILPISLSPRERVGVREEELPSAVEGQEVALVLDRTPFYAERGGQVGDTGTVTSGEWRVASGEEIGHRSSVIGHFVVNDTQEPVDGVILHIGRVERGEFRPGDRVIARVDGARREGIMRAHSATHLLHKALRNVLGDHVAQAGSLVEDDRLRFDFSHFEATSDEALERIEFDVNERILQGLTVQTEEMDLQSALQSGAVALFGEKYGGTVRVVRMVGGQGSGVRGQGEAYSAELCGGTHLDEVSRIGLLKIVAESSIGAGVRRIEALTGKAALAYVREREKTTVEAARLLNVPIDGIVDRIRGLQETIRDLRRTVGAGPRARPTEVNDLLSSAIEMEGLGRIVASAVKEASGDDLHAMADALADRSEGVVVVLGTVQGDRVPLVCKISEGLVQRGLHAGTIAARVAKIMGGSGGGSPHFARGGGKDPSKLQEALAAVPDIVRQFLEGQIQ